MPLRRRLRAPSRIGVTAKQDVTPAASARDGRDADALSAEGPERERAPVRRPRRRPLKRRVEREAHEHASLLPSGTCDLDRPSCASGPMVDPNVGEALTVARPRGRGQFVVVRPRARGNEHAEAAPVRADRGEAAPGMPAPPGPGEDDRPAVRGPGRVYALGRPAACADTPQAASVGIHDPEAAPTGADPSAERDLPVARAPADSRAVGVDLTDPVDIAPVALHHEEGADARLGIRADEGDVLPVTRPGRRPVTWICRQPLEPPVRRAPPDPSAGDGDRSAGGRCAARAGGGCDRCTHDGSRRRRT